MKVVAFVQFEDAEQHVLERALKGHEGVLLDPPRNRKEQSRLPVRVHLSRIVQHEEPYSQEALLDLDRTLGRLIELWEPETTAEAWRKLGAPGSDEAVEGLARERRNAIERAQGARALVLRALAEVG
jgi:hypothetical protein